MLSQISVTDLWTPRRISTTMMQAMTSFQIWMKWNLINSNNSNYNHNKTDWKILIWTVIVEKIWRMMKICFRTYSKMLFKLLIQIDNKSYRKCSRKRLSQLVKCNKCKGLRNLRIHLKASEELDRLVEEARLVVAELVVD